MQDARVAFKLKEFLSKSGIKVAARKTIAQTLNPVVLFQLHSFSCVHLALV